ncbi:ribosomal RNA small subunit methyltransferase NEP1-like [Panonychus citri]|uniref:ribosomal RNA small subunit methyltransferase NEP1-like n=1 Tax=Panonychus citri TaxID=50023 RepID=UPI0023078E1A|nr:ribosomal RNA small subunit methyltransferase NEP1-like [Panonychus citri]
MSNYKRRDFDGKKEGGDGEPSEKIIRPKLFKSAKDHSKRLIVILEKANLEVIKVGTGDKYELLNCDDHMSYIRKFKKDPAFCRPDITHQCLLMLFDSPLNRAGLLQVYVHSMQNVLIEINPATRFPRTFKRFANLMVQLLHKLSIRAAGGSDRLMRVIKNPITAHLPVGCRKIGTSFNCDKLVTCKELIPSDESPLAIVIGAMAHGQTEADYVEETVAISQYPLSGALACTKIVSAFEEAWEIH